MNYGIILLIVLLVLAAIEVLVGIRRGAPLVGVRVALWAVLAVVAGLIAEPVARAVINLNLRRITLFGSLQTGAFGVSGMTDAIDRVIPGYVLSALTPFVFAVLFIVMKFVSWIIYLIVKKGLLKKSDSVFQNNSTAKKVIGGVAGLIVGIWACAIIASPVSGLIKTVDDSGVVDSAFGIGSKILTLRGTSVDDILAGKVRGTSDSDKEIVAGMTLTDIRDSFTSVAKTPASAVCRYTGGEWIAMKLYRSMSQIKAGQEVYDLPTALTEALSITGDADGVMTLLTDGSGYSSGLVTACENLVFKLLDGKLTGQLVSESARVDMVNSFLPSVEKSLKSMLGIKDSSDDMLKPFETYESFYGDLAVVFDIADIPAGMIADGKDAEIKSINDITAQKLMSDKDKVGDLFVLLSKLNSGPEMISALINSAYPDYGAITSPEKVAAVDTDALSKLCDDMLFLSETEPGDVNTDNYKSYMEVIDRVNTSGILNKKIEP